jgi:hypothetical protein
LPVSRLIRNGIVIAAVVAIAIAVRVFLPTDVDSLSVGQCFDPPAETGEVSGVDDGPCTDTHHAEVVFVGDYTPASDLYPTTSGFREFVVTTCVTAFNNYTGLDIVSQTTYDLDAFTPTSDGWSKGKRAVTCFAVRIDEGPMTQSIKKT